MRRYIRPMLVACATMLLIGSCADNPTAPEPAVPGTLLFTWTSPNQDDRAAVVQIVLPAGLTGGAATAVPGGVELFQRRSADTLRIAVFGPLVNGVLLSLDVADLRRATGIRTAVVEVAAEDDALRESVDAYALTVVRQ